MFKYARTKEFIVSTQPGDSFSEAIPIKGATKLVVNRHNTTNSFSSGNSFSLSIYGSYDGVTYRSIYNNLGLGTGYIREFFTGTEQTTKLSDEVLDVCIGFNFIKLYNKVSTNTATCTYKVNVIS